MGGFSVEFTASDQAVELGQDLGADQGRRQQLKLRWHHGLEPNVAERGLNHKLKGVGRMGTVAGEAGTPSTAAEKAGGGTPASNDDRAILTAIDSQLDHGAMSSNTLSFALPEALGGLR